MYKIKSGSIQYLKDNGFKKMGEDFYSLRFPVYFYKKTPIIFCIATIDLSIGKRINLEVEKNGQPYMLWYENNTQLAPDLLKEINTAIDRKLHKIGARHYGD